MARLCCQCRDGQNGNPGLERHRGGRAERLVWLLPPLELLWANSHGGFFLGWVTVGAYVAGSRGLSSERRKTLLYVSAAVFLVAGLNPNGFRILEVLPAYRASFLTSTLIEWRPPFWWGPPYTYNVLLYGAAAVLLLSWRVARLTDALLFTAFAAASLTAFRNTPLIAFLAPVLVAAYGGPLVTATLARIGSPAAVARADVTLCRRGGNGRRRRGLHPTIDRGASVSTSRGGVEVPRDRRALSPRERSRAADVQLL